MYRFVYAQLSSSNSCVVCLFFWCWCSHRALVWRQRVRQSAARRTLRPLLFTTRPTLERLVVSFFHATPYNISSNFFFRCKFDGISVISKDFLKMYNVNQKCISSVWFMALTLLYSTCVTKITLYEEKRSTRIRPNAPCCATAEKTAFLILFCRLRCFPSLCSFRLLCLSFFYAGCNSRWIIINIRRVCPWAWN